MNAAVVVFKVASFLSKFQDILTASLLMRSYVGFFSKKDSRVSLSSNQFSTYISRLREKKFNLGKKMALVCLCDDDLTIRVDFTQNMF